MPAVKCEIVKWSRRELGRSIPFSRPIYGWSWTCSCGKEQKTNETKANALKWWRAHRRTKMAREK